MLHHTLPVLHHPFSVLHNLQLSPEDAEEYIKYLLTIGKLDEAALKMADIVNDESFVSKEGKSRYQLWHELCELIAKNPDKVCACVCVCVCVLEKWRGGRNGYNWERVGGQWAAVGGQCAPEGGQCAAEGSSVQQRVAVCSGGWLSVLSTSAD